jgi:hypothetical protein
MTRDDAPVALLAALGLIALAMASRSTGPISRAHRKPRDPHVSLTGYLHDHLMGADAATEVVDRLRRSHAGTPVGVLFESLYRRFVRDRSVVEGLLSDLDASPRSVKRAMGGAAGKALQAMTGGAIDDLSLFQALEGLAIGVQGKRCMWRALQDVEPPLNAPLTTLESDAVRQWEAIERCRRPLAASLFSGRAALRSCESHGTGERDESSKRPGSP